MKWLQCDFENADGMVRGVADELGASESGEPRRHHPPLEAIFRSRCFDIDCTQSGRASA